MTQVFSPSGNLNVSWDASDLPSQRADNNESSGEMVRCKNLRIDQRGKAYLRDGSSKINAVALNTSIWLVEEMDGSRFVFAGTNIYEDEASLSAAMTSAAWAAMQYNAFNDSTKQIFALNGTNRVRVISGEVNNWGIEAPTVAPVLSSGGGGELSGEYNVRYTYVRKVGTAIVAESNPSPAASASFNLTEQSLSISMTDSTDSQVTHIRVYRTLSGGEIYYLDAEIPSANEYTYGMSHQWEEDQVYIAGNGYKFTYTDTTHNTENTYSWEENFERQIETTAAEPDYGPTIIPQRDIPEEGEYQTVYWARSRR